MVFVSASRRVLLLAPYGRDAATLVDVLRVRGFLSEDVASIQALADKLDDSVGAVVVTEEAIVGDMTTLLDALRRQEPWSDIPFILLRAARSSSPGLRPSLPEEALNVIELERPLSSTSVASAVSTALRARQKQFSLREHMARLEESESALRESHSELRLIADSLPVLIAFIDKNLVYRFANRAYEDWFGMPVSKVLGHRVDEVLGADVWKERRQAVASVLNGEAVRLEASWPTVDGQQREAEIRYLPRMGASGEVDGFHVFATDITDRKVALEATRLQAAALEVRVRERTAALQAEMQAREASEAALRQAQKMEAVGQLTGGIAHDFNNMLTGILAAMDLMRMRVDAGNFDGIGRLVDTATASAQRAAGLTQRLLAFSRRQTLDPKPVDVNAMVASMEELFVRTLGEDIRLHVVLQAGLPLALADANQLESALLNLVINARDAMPDGGDLTVQTTTSAGKAGGGAASGECVVLSVTDTGIGMDEALLARVFEPFFTTKPLGQGTGLGMSMIYGFIKQSNGNIDISSAPGKGTMVRLEVPVAREDLVSSSDERSARVDGNGQSVLVVEDDLQVRSLVSELLSTLGYTVHAAAAADEALTLLPSIMGLDLLVTDVGLPGLNGRQLADLVRQSLPDLPVLFMTGYAGKVPTRAGFLGDNMSMISKPFDLDDFSSSVARMLAPPLAPI
jgi:PAS domain S-box-containing protein